MLGILIVYEAILSPYYLLKGLIDCQAICCKDGLLARRVVGRTEKKRRNVGSRGDENRGIAHSNRYGGQGGIFATEPPLAPDSEPGGRQEERRERGDQNDGGEAGCPYVRMIPVCVPHLLDMKGLMRSTL